MSHEICTVCWGLKKEKCEGCGMNTADWRKAIGVPAVEANAYWLTTWFKLRKFAQETSGDLETDWKCRNMFGPWLTITMDRMILYSILDQLHKGLSTIICGYLTNDSYLWLGTVLSSYNLRFTFEENRIVFENGFVPRQEQTEKLSAIDQLLKTLQSSTIHEHAG